MKEKGSGKMGASILFLCFSFACFFVVLNSVFIYKYMSKEVNNFYNEKRAPRADQNCSKTKKKNNDYIYIYISVCIGEGAFSFKSASMRFYCQRETCVRDTPPFFSSHLVCVAVPSEH
jgi:hypothetical protein